MNRLRGRAVLTLSSNARYKVKGVHPGTKVKQAKRRLHLAGATKIGGSRWYFARRGKSTVVVNASGGRVSEIGLAVTQLTGDRRAQKRFLASIL